MIDKIVNLPLLLNPLNWFIVLFMVILGSIPLALVWQAQHGNK